MSTFFGFPATENFPGGRLPSRNISSRISGLFISFQRLNGRLRSFISVIFRFNTTACWSVNFVFSVVFSNSCSFLFSLCSFIRYNRYRSFLSKIYSCKMISVTFVDRLHDVVGLDYNFCGLVIFLITLLESSDSSFGNFISDAVDTA